MPVFDLKQICGGLFAGRGSQDSSIDSMHYSCTETFEYGQMCFIRLIDRLTACLWIGVKEDRNVYNIYDMHSNSQLPTNSSEVELPHSASKT